MLKSPLLNCAGSPKRRPTNITTGAISSGDMVAISTKKRYGIITGFVASIKDNTVEITSDHTLPRKGEERYFMDRIESLSTHSMQMANVAGFMQDEALRNDLRRFIIDLDVPEAGKITKSDLARIKPLLSKLSREQARAVVKALICKNYTLIEGLPGAGKSTTLAAVVKCFLLFGKSVLVTSHTHSAVDNLFEKLLDDIPADDMLRIGNAKSVKLKVSHLCIEEKLKSITTERYEAMKKMLTSVKVVGATCLSVCSHPLFSFRRFDVCLVDEASLAVESSLLAPLSACSRFVLVGDAKQLAPLVQSRDAKELGMDVSLFERLQVHKESQASLTSQYRMNSRIAALASKLFYDGLLKCATDEVANGRLQISEYHGNASISLVFSPLLEHSVVFVDTDSAGNDDAKMSMEGRGATSNVYEAAIIGEMCGKFLKFGVCASDIGVICTYRRQVEVVRSQIGDSRIEVNTVDQFQGRDKSVIIWSLVWTRGDSRCELLNDRRRINVAITRPKHKLILIGCRQSMAEVSSTMNELLNLIPPSDVLRPTDL
ncbi:unnamed protein product, partial [Mesorhabditis spiculigera]